MTRPMPWDKWFFDDLDRDCGALSLQARGAWVWIIGDLRNHEGQRALTLQGWAQVIRATIPQTVAVLSELILAKTCDSSVSPDAILTQKCFSNDAMLTLKCRRQLREAKENKQHALRQQRYTKKRSTDGRNDATLTQNRRNTDRQEAEKQEAEKQESPIAPLNGNGNLTLESMFLILWECYPEHRRTKRDLAIHEFVKLRPTKTLLDRMILAIDKLKTSDDWTRESGKYIPGCANWIINRGWEAVKVDVICHTCQRIGVIVRNNGSILPWSLKREVDEGLKPEVCPECKGKNRVNTPGLPNVKF